MKHIVSFSGGKDSTAMLLRLVEENKPIDEIIFCDTGVEFPDMIEHINKVSEYINMPITILRADKSFEYIFTKQKRPPSSKYSDVEGYGWSSAKRRWCTNMLKTAVFKQYLKSQDEYRTYIGLAYDEQRRILRNKDSRNLYPLNDWKMTEADCLQYCYERGFDWNGLYKIFKRVSCYLCPLQRKADWLNLEKYYPDLFRHAIELDRVSPYRFSPNETLEQRIARWHKGDNQQELFEGDKE